MPGLSGPGARYLSHGASNGGVKFPVAAARKGNAGMPTHQAEFITSKAEHEKHADATGMAAVYEYAHDRAEMGMEPADRMLTRYRSE